jgi:hypothetical protein
LFELALQLHKTVGQLLVTMSHVEYRMWSEFFSNRPIGWREDDRAFKLMKTFGSDLKPGQAFSSLGSMAEKEKERASYPKVGTPFHTMLLNAKGGDKLEILKEMK